MTAAILDLTSHIGKLAQPAYRKDMGEPIDPPEHLDSHLAAAVLALPPELLQWVALVGPRIAAMSEDDRAHVLGQMGSIAGGGTPPPSVTIAVGENVVTVNTTDVSGSVIDLTKD